MIRVGVLRGGISDEFEVSIKTGGNVLAQLPKDKYEGVDILITRDGTWHVGGVPKTLDDLDLHIDVAFNALHGEYGEDGKVSRILEDLKIPYTGSEAVPASLSFNKTMAKDVFKRAGIRTPIGITVEDYRDSVIGSNGTEKISELAHKIFRSIPPPWILKPASGGSSINTFVAKNFAELVDALVGLFDYGGDLVVEQFIRGREVSSGIIENFRNERKYPTMPVEIINKRDFFDDEAKKNLEFDCPYICPCSITRAQKDEVMDIAKRAHDALGLRDYSRSDFIVTPRSVYLLEVNNLPGLTPHSILTRSLETVGSNIGELADHLITLALARKYR